MKRLSLAQQIAELEDVAPVDFDPEDVEVKGIDHEDGAAEDCGAARAHYVDVGPSVLRQAHDSIADPKYEGIHTSRKALLEYTDDAGDSSEDSEDEDSDYQVEDDEHEVDGRDLRGQKSYDHEAHSFEDEREYQPEHEAHPSADASINQPYPSDNQDNDLSTNLRKTREEDQKKGEAIAKQLALWDSLLDARIRLHKSVTAGNRLPTLSLHADSEEVQASLVRMLEETHLLSNELFSFQESLLSSNEGIQLPPRKRLRSAVEPSIDNCTAEFREASLDLSSLHYSHHPHLIQTLNKWSAKIQAASPSVLLPSTRNVFSKSTQHLKSAAQLIDETLADHNKMLARTRVYRGKDMRLGIKADEPAEEDVTIFDDTDFYQQLLRDVIDSRSESGGSHDWMAGQKERKAKKKVDTKASKGRKLRYQVHEKMQNFMVPVPTHASWHEEQIDELFASLLGKGFEEAMQEVGGNDTTTSLQGQVDAALRDGFRVFG